MTIEPAVLRTHEAERVLGVTRKVLMQMKRDGQLRAWKTSEPHGHWRWLREDVERLAKGAGK